MIDRDFVKRLKWLTLGTLLVFLSSSLLSGQVRAADEASVEVGITPNPLAVSVFAPSEVIKGDDFTVSAQIKNLGDEEIKETVASIHLDNNGLSLDKKEVENQIGMIQSREMITVDWSVKVVETGVYIILVSVSGRGVTGDLTAQDTVIVTVNE